MKLDNYCSDCGVKFNEYIDLYPKGCKACRNVTYKNPIPVILTVPIFNDGVLLIKRNNDPEKGKWAFPGGYIEFGETWQDAAARELYEEINLIILDKNELDLVDIKTAKSGNLIIFSEIMIKRHIEFDDFARAFRPNDEVSEIKLVKFIVPYMELAFPTHEDMLGKYVIYI